MKIISGGQTGVDRGALRGARAAGHPTGGTAPKGWRTENGEDQMHMESMGMVECKARGYPARTHQNVVNSDATLIIATDFKSRGTALTIKCCRAENKPFRLKEVNHFRFDYLATSDHKLISWLIENDVKVLNVAGQRESKCIGIEEHTLNFIKRTLECMPMQGSDLKSVEEQCDNPD